jgi:probable HAF family extracellular repeat protein
MRVRLASAALALLLAAASASAQTYHVVDIGTLEGFLHSSANGINDDGLVVGTLFATDSDTRAFRYTESMGLVVLEGFAPGTPASANAVNDAGVVVGRGAVAFAGSSAVRWSSEGVPELLGSAASISQSISALAVNEAGEAAGSVSNITFPPSSSSLLWSAAGDVVAGFSNSGAARGINDSGQVVGVFSESLFATGVYLWSEAEGFVELFGLPGATTSSAFGINAAGVAVGTSGTSSSSTLATVWAPAAQAMSLGVLSGGTRSVANAINDLGVIVGFSDTESGQHAMVWTAADGMRDLNALSDAAAIEMTLQDAKAINTSGQIVGYGDVGGSLHAFLATPVPEAAAAWPAFVALLWLRRRA